MKPYNHPVLYLQRFSSPRVYLLLLLPVGLFLLESSRRTHIVLNTSKETKNGPAILKRGHTNNTGASTNHVQKFCEGANSTFSCIFNIGFGVELDAMKYLSHGEFRVVSFDGNSNLVSNARKKFSNDISKNHYRVVHSLIVPEESGKTIFWQNNEKSIFSSVREEEGCRAGNGTKMPRGDHRYCEPVRFEKVKRQNCRQLVERFGVPVVLKSEIKEDESGCINSLFNLPETMLPQLVAFAGAAQTKYLSRLDSMGYKKFRVVNQAVLDATMPKTVLHLEGYDVSWGDHVLDQFIDANWYTLAEMRSQYPISAEVEGRKVLDSGYDLHATF